MRVEQFVYTKGKGGYQVVASSGGVGRDTIGEMQGYMYPAGVDPLAFSESRSLVTLDGGLAAYSIVQNVGVGPDGRDGTFYNHTFVMDAKEFQKSGCDSRPFDRLYMGGMGQGGELSTMRVHPPEMPSMPSGDAAAALEGALEALLAGKNLAVASGDPRLPQEILMALPRHLRLVPFSTLVISPARQPKYRLIMNPGFKVSPPSGFVTVDPAMPARAREYLSYYSRLVLGHEQKKIKDIQTTFESIPGGTDLQKLDLSCAYSAYCAAGASERADQARRVMRIAGRLGRKTRFMFYDWIRNTLPRDTRHAAGPASLPDGPDAASGFMPSADQSRVIAHRRGYLAVAARPGSGKTETISRRIACMISEMDGKSADGIVAFTFTVKAAEELRARIQKNLGEGASMPQGMFVGTIDSFCLAMLKRLDPKYHAYDVLLNLERVAFIDVHRERLGISKLDGSTYGYKIKKFCNTADIVTKESIPPHKIPDVDFAASYKEYLRALDDEKFMDFGIVAGRLLDLLSSDRGNLAQLGVTHLVVDEYQDVDPQQQRLIEMLSEGAISVCAVGDADQTIFQWRGSDPGRLDEFKEKTEDKNGTTVELATNYRATDGLVKCASRLIAHNHAGKTEMRADPSQPNRFGHGDLVYKTLAGREETCEFIHRSIMSLAGRRFETKDGGHSITYGDMAVLVHTNRDAADVAKFLRSNNIECEVEGGTAGFRDNVAKLALDCLLYALGPRDRRTMDDLGRRCLLTLGSDPFTFGSGMVEAVASACANPRTKQSRRGSLALLQVLSAMGAEHGSVRDHMPSLADLSKAIAGYEYANGGLTVEEARNIGAFIKTLEQFGFSIPSDRGASGKVRIMTIWRAKGLEFPVVFAPKLAKKHIQMKDQNYLDGAPYPAERYRGGKDYDRRLLYTAITRSQKYLVLTDTESAKQEFMPEMGDDLFSGDLPAGEGAGDVAREQIWHLAYEEVEAYRRCPHEYYLRHVLEYREGLKPEFDYVENVLAMLDVIHAGGRRGSVPSEAKIGEMADVMFHMRLATNSMESKLRKDAVRMLSRYAERREMILGNAGSAIKTRLEFDGSGVTDVADLVGGDGSATLFEPRGGAEKEHDRHAERARFRAISAVPGEGYVYYLSTGCKRKAEAEGVLEEISRAVSGINAGDLEATPEKKKCEKCDFALVCDRKGPALDGTG